MSGTVWTFAFGLLAIKPARFAALVSSTVNALQQARSSLPGLEVPEGAIGFIIAIICVFTPYVIGLALLPLSVGFAELADGIHESIYKKYRGSTKYFPQFMAWLTRRVDGTNQSIRDSAYGLLNTRFGVEQAKFRTMESFLLHTDSKFANRLTNFVDQIHLYDSLMLPFPLLIGLLLVRLSSVSLVVSILIAFCLFWLFLRRTMILRGYRRLSLAIAFIVAVGDKTEKGPAEFRLDIRVSE